MIDYLTHLRNRGYVLGLDNIKRTLEKLDHPDQKTKIIHVAGTNGKGSICTYLQNILMAQGYKVGLFTSPEILTFYDRIKINDQEIEEDEFKRLLIQIKELTEQDNIPITEFEFLTALALLYFANEKCDYTILEVGMGGRLDATNGISKKEISIISRIGKDHTEYLGESLSEIAREKAGIISKDTPVVIYQQEPIIMDEIRKIASEKNAKVYTNDPGEIIEVNDPQYNVFSYKDYQNITLQLQGEHQRKNASVAIEAMEVLNRNCNVVTKDNILLGLKNATIPGRFDLVHKNPTVIVDGGHNSQAVKELNQSLKKKYPNEKFLFIIGMMKDKEYQKVIEIIAPIAEAFVTITPDHERALSSTKLAQFIGMFNDHVYDKKNLDNALNFALQEYEHKRIVVLGSLYSIRKVYDYFEGDFDE